MFNFIKRLFGAATPIAVTTPSAGNFARAFHLPGSEALGRPAPRDYQRYLNQYYRGWAHHCIMINAQAISRVPFSLFASGASRSGSPASPDQRARAERQAWIKTVRRTNEDMTEVKRHMALDVLSRPNKYMHGSEFLQLIEIYLGTTGNCFIWKQRNAMGVVDPDMIDDEQSGLWILPAQNMTIVPGERKLVEGYLFRKEGAESVGFEFDEVIHLRRPNPLDPYYYGLGELESEIDMAVLNRIVDEYDIHTLENSARPDLVASSEEFITQEDVKVLRRELEHALSGPQNARRMAVMGGGLKLTPINWNPQDISYLGAEDKVMRRIAAAFGIPKSMLTTDDVNLANAAIGERQHARHAIAPRLCKLEESFTVQWIQEYDERLFLMFDSPVQDDPLQQAQISDIDIRNGAMTPNERREQIGREPIEGGDETALQRAERMQQEIAEQAGDGNGENDDGDQGSRPAGRRRQQDAARPRPRDPASAAGNRQSTPPAPGRRPSR